MVLLEISIQYRVVIGISAMVMLFSSFLVAFISSQRKKLQYHKNLQALHEEQQQNLKQQNMLLEKRVTERTAEIVQQTETLQKTLNELKASQLQLVQKEKMASLGELTAGIAHEIQNPLNFVNNFAEVNADLLTDINDKLADAELPIQISAEINSIIGDLTGNMQKIMQHGKRADNIVKNMLQHSQTHAGTMELADLNALADEYLKLSYHGFKTKNKLFNCTIETVFDNNLESINIVPQDIGRILVNLYNNAFYAINEKIKNVTAVDNGDGFKGRLSIDTQKLGTKAIVTIKDNGTGIPAKYLDKIFQPFFTTKPTGQGTGLGLSLAYDIVKAHGGEINVDTIAGEGTAFTFSLPIV